MQIYDIICGQCNGSSFKYVDGECKCQGCGYALTDDEIQNLLHQAHVSYLADKKANELKLRAWNKVDKTMYTDAINNGKDSLDLMMKHPQIYEVMRFTGLTDRSGVEIYEGDILMQNNNPKDLVEVCFGEFEVRLIETEEVIDKVVGWHTKVIKTDALSEVAPFCYDGILSEYWIGQLDSVIVGNIYANADLVK